MAVLGLCASGATADASRLGRHGEFPRKPGEATMAESSGRDEWDECLDAALEVARQAGEVVRAALKTDKEVLTKSSEADLVTETDQKVEKLIISFLQHKFPSHRFIGEESVAAGEGCHLEDAPTWIIDPVDGTTNFVHTFPFVAVSIGFAVKKQLELGVVYSCADDKMYSARRGRGARCNGEALSVSGKHDLSKALLLTEMGSNRDAVEMKTTLGNMHRLLATPLHGIRQLGSAALNMCAVAAGFAEAYYEFGIHCWDMAAAAVIVREAGGVLTDTAGGPFDLMSRRVIAANSKAIAGAIAAVLEQRQPERDDAAH